MVLQMRNIASILFISICGVFQAINGADRSSDSLALVALRNANPTVALGWDDTLTINKWSGVTLVNNRVVQLVLQAKGLAVLPPEFGNLTELLVLYGMQNNFTSIPFTVGNLQKLKILGLAYNQITTVPPELYTIKGLQQLDLSFNKIVGIDNAVSGLYSLVFIGVGGCSLTEFPIAITKLKNLRELTIQDNKLTTLPKEFGNLTNLQIIMGANNSFESLPDEIGNCKALIKISVQNSKLTSLPASLAGLPALRELFVGKNQIAALPLGFSSLTTLTNCDLSNNKLTELPASFGSLTNLVTFNVGNNLLTELPATFGTLKNLTTLYLNNNQLTSLPESFGGLNSLTTFSAMVNQLSVIPEAIGECTKLENLYLSNNKIDQILTSFSNCKKIWTMELNYNNLDIAELKNISIKIPFLSYDYQNRIPLLLTPDSSALFVSVRGATAKTEYTWYRGKQGEIEMFADRVSTNRVLPVTPADIASGDYFFCEIDHRGSESPNRILLELKSVQSPYTIKADTTIPTAIVNKPELHSRSFTLRGSCQQLSVDLSEAGRLEMELYTIMGRRVAVIPSVSVSAGHNVLPIPSGVAMGTYIVRGSFQGRTFTQKLFLK